VISVLAAQIARIEGARVIGIASHKEKSQWLIDKSCVDALISYRTEGLDARLAELAPGGIDLFFDNVGGSQLDTVLAHMRKHGRVICCGAIENYEHLRRPTPLSNVGLIISERLSMQGFLYFDYRKEFSEATAKLESLLRRDLLKFRADVETGLEFAPRGLRRLFSGENRGKQLINVAT